MSEKTSALVADKEHVRLLDGTLIATVWEEYPSKDRLPGESWLQMMDRTALAREASKQKTIARARLLSAAPDLLEALKELIACCDELESWTPPMGSACETARAAIAKATAA